MGISVSRPLALALSTSPICIYQPRPLICIYPPWLIRMGNNKSQSLDIMLLFLFLLFNSFVTVIIDRNETKGNLSKTKLTNTTDYYKSTQTKEKNKVKSTESN